MAQILEGSGVIQKLPTTSPQHSDIPLFALIHNLMNQKNEYRNK